MYDFIIAMLYIICMQKKIMPYNQPINISACSMRFVANNWAKEEQVYHMCDVLTNLYINIRLDIAFIDIFYLNLK